MSELERTLVIVGGGPTAHAALSAYRKSGGDPARVVMISEDDRAPYNRPPLSKDFLRGESDEESLPLAEEGFYTESGGELLLSDSVISMDIATQTIRTRSGREIHYDACILATGGTPATLDVPGGDSALLLRWFDQARRLRDTAQSATTAVVVGSGFVGCEAAASLAARGIVVTMVSSEARPQLDRLGPVAADLIHGWLTDAGVRIHSSTEVSEINGTTVRLSDGTWLSADLLLTAVGVVPRVELAEQAGLLVERGRVVVDEHMRTSVAGVFAAGDVVSAFNAAAGRHLSVEHWGEAERMGEIAGTMAAGGNAQWSETPGFWSEIGAHTLKYAAWGDGFDSATPVEHDNGGMTIWYGKDGVIVGVLTSEADDDYERGTELVNAAAPVPVPAA